MQDQSTIIKQFRALPRAARWGIIGVTLVVLGIGYADLIYKNSVEFKDKADRYERKLVQLRTAAGQTETIDNLRPVIETAGPTEPLKRRRQQDVSNELTAAINSVLLNARVDSIHFDQSNAQQMARMKLLSAATDGAGKPMRVRVTVNFEARPETAIAVISDLESLPEVHRIKMLRLQKLGSSKKLRISLDLESWFKGTVIR